MKIITPALATHLAQPVTTLATLWKVKRTDGVKLGFTDHDQNIIYNANDGDGPITYVASFGFTPSAVDQGSEFGTDNLEVTAFMDVAAITDADLRAGLYNFSTIEIRIVNYADLTMGELKLRRGTAGVVQLAAGIGRFEIRGLSFRFGTTLGQTYGPICRVELGDVKCGVKLTPTAIAAAPTGLTQVGFVVTVTTAVPHQLSAGQIVQVAGAGIAGYNGTFTVLAVNNTTQFTYTNTVSGLAASGGGTVGLRQASSVASVIDRQTFAPVAGLVGTGETVASKTVGPLFPATVEEPTQLPGGSGVDGWVNEANAKTNDDLFATQTGTAPSLQTPLRARNFFTSATAIPLNAIIMGIQVTVRRKTTVGNTTKDQTVQLVKGGTAVGSNKADINLFWPLASTDKVYGGPTDLWGTSWSPSDVNDPDFGVEVTSTGGNGAIDSYSIIVSYQLFSSGYFSDGIVTFTSGLNNGFSKEVTLWDGATIRLFEGMPFNIQAGDTFTIEPGCSLTIADCQNKFNNIVNFRGEPFIPGMDQLLIYPNAGGKVP